MWFSELFKTFGEELIDEHQDVFEILIDNMDFNDPTVRIQKVESVVAG